MALLFAFVQFEFGFRLGPGDGRFLIRPEAGEPPECVLVLSTLGAAERRRLRGRRGRSVAEAQPAAVPTTRATLVRPDPLADERDGREWLARLRAQADLAHTEIAAAERHLGRALHAHRVACADPYARDVSAQQALVVRIGYGDGEGVAEGRYAEAWEPAPETRRTRRSMEAPEERFAALLGGREQALVCEELVLRARADLDAGRPRQAALQARVALEGVLAEPEGTIPADRRDALERDRRDVGEAANAALRGELPDPIREALGAAVVRMEGALSARRLRSSR